MDYKLHLDISIEELELNNGWLGQQDDDSEIELTELLK